MRIAVALTPVLFFLVIIGIAVTNLVWRADFAVPYTGGLILREGHAAKLYDVHEQKQVQRRWLKRGDLLLDPYPPFHAALFAPLTRLGYRTAYVVWGAFNVLLWVWFRHLFSTRAGIAIEPYRYLKACALFFPVATTLIQGQFSLLLLVAFTLCFLCLRQKQEYSAGFALGLGLLKFQVVFPFALILLLRRKWRFMVGLAAAIMIVLLVSVVVVGPSSLAACMKLVMDTMRRPENAAYSKINSGNMPTLNGFVAGVLGRSLPHLWSSGLYMVLSGSLILFMAQRWGATAERQSRERSDLMFAAALVVSMLTAPYLHVHDLTPALLAILLVGGSPRWKVNSPECLTLSFVIAVLYGMPVYYGFLLRWHVVYLLVPALLAFVVAVLYLAGKPVEEKPLQLRRTEPYSVPTGSVGVTD
jgi:Glycosyltransferase family 87